MSPSQRAVVTQYFAYLNVYDFDGLASLFSTNFVHEFRPASIDGMGLPVRNGAQFLEFLKGLKELLVTLNFRTPSEVIVADDAIVAHVASEGKTVMKTSFPNEHLFIFRFEGEKIASIKEFMDSKYVAQLGEDEKAAKA